MRYFITCIKRVSRLPGTDRGGISEFGIAEVPGGEPIAHKTYAEIVDDISHGRHDYISPAKDDMQNESKWAALEVVWRRGDEFVKTEPGYEPKAYLNNKPTCRHRER